MAEERVLTPSRDPMGNSTCSVDVRAAAATLKRVAPLIADSRPTKLGAKHRRTSSSSTPTTSHRRPLFGSGGRGGGTAAAEDKSRGRSGVHKQQEEDDSERLLRERVEGIALETERMRSSRERAASFAAADRRLDEEFLESFGVSLDGPGTTTAATAGGGGASLPTFDRERLKSALPLGSGADGAERGQAEEREYIARQRKAAATLSPAEYKCWEIREEIDRYRRQEESMRAQIFNGDPLLPLVGDSRGGGIGMELGASP